MTEREFALKIASFATAIAELNVGGDVNEEYMRGQIELATDVVGFSDDPEPVRELLAAFVAAIHEHDERESRRARRAHN